MNDLHEILKSLLLAVFVISSNIISAQSYNTTSKKAVKYFNEAHREYLDGNYQKSLLFVNEALDKDDAYADALLLKAEICLELNDTMAMSSYERLLDVDSMYYPPSAVSLSKLYAKCYFYEKASDVLRWYLSLKNQKESIRQLAEKQLSLVEFQKSLVENPVDYKPVNIGTVVNTSADEYVNQYYVDENKLVFTKRYKTDIEGLYEENVFVSVMYDSVWTIPYPLLKDIDNIGAACVSSDGNVVYFSGCGWEDGFGSCDIYYMEFKNGCWSEPKNIKSINSSDWESQPCVSYDGKELYFVKRNKHLGTSDIYVSKKDDEDNWMKPYILSSNINTDGNEMAPFIHHDGKTLYFSSDGHLGMGGYDLFVSRRDMNDVWSKAINLGYPLNTSDDEINIVISNDAKKAFVSANNATLDDVMSYDIFEFNLDDDFRPEPIEIEIPTDEDYYASLIDRGEPIVLKDIYFEFDSAELAEDSEDGINVILNFLNDNPDVNVILEGHTDDVGNEDYNMALSERRAENVKNALIDRGVSAERIKAKGCGSTQPLLPNKLNDELKFLNRRVTMTVVKEL